MIIVSKWAAAALLAILLATPPLALAAPPDAAAWRVDTARSTLSFSGTETGTRFTGTFQHFDADIRFDPAHLDTARFSVTVDLASAASGDKQRDLAMPDADWFDVSKYPRARFVSSAIRRTGAGAYTAAGTLTIRGVSKPVILNFTLTIEGSTAHAKGQAQIVRTNFGVGQGPWRSGQWVGLDVEVLVNLVATRPGHTN